MSTVESQLCVGCGLCCDGTLYDRAKVSSGEEGKMLAAELELFDEGDKRLFRLPCRHFGCGRCLIHETRFEICHSYECALLKSVKAGKANLADARRKITMARGLLAKVVASDPEARTAAGRKVARSQLAGNLQEGQTASRLLDIIALDTFLKRYFRLPHEDESQRPIDS